MPSPEVFKSPEPPSEPESFNIDEYSQPSTNIILDVKPFQTALDSLTLCSVCYKETFRSFKPPKLVFLHTYVCNVIRKCSSHITLWNVSGIKNQSCRLDNR